MLGLVHIACQYYKRVLSLEPEKCTNEDEENRKVGMCLYHH